MATTGTILFLCPHNAAKSVLAAAYFDQGAVARGLPFRADSAGTDPDAHPSPAVVAALRAEGIDVTGHRPRRVTAADLTRASRVISLGCNPDDVPEADVLLERWDDVPPVSQELEVARLAIRHRVATLLEDLARETPPTAETA